MMRRVCSTLDLADDADLIAEYEQLHMPGGVWPEVAAYIRATGVEQMQIWRDGTRMFMVSEVTADYPRPAPPPLTAAAARWEALMLRFQRPLSDGNGEKWRPMRLIFDLDAHPSPDHTPSPPTRRTIGRTGLRVSEIGFGAAPLGNLYRPLADNVARETLATALDCGLGYVDTAPYYGFGLSERRVGDAIRGRPDTVISTKVGRLLRPSPNESGMGERHGFHAALPFEPVYDYSYDGIMRSHAASLDRLGLARIDILYVHDIGAVTHGNRQGEMFSQLTQGGGFKALQSLKDQGAITAFGIGVNEVAACLDCLEVADLDAILLAGRYTLLEQGALDKLLPECARRGTSIIIGGVFNSGILATGTRSKTVPCYNYGPAPAAVVERVQRIEQICDRHQVPLPAAALQFVLAHPQVASVIPGLDSPERVHAIRRFHQTPIPPDFWAALRQGGLLHPDAPLPGLESA
jgi:D-threo-aldose 1-dehydrogenase